MQPIYFTRRESGGMVSIYRGYTPGTGHGDLVRTVRECNAARVVDSLYRRDRDREYRDRLRRSMRGVIRDMVALADGRA